MSRSPADPHAPAAARSVDLSADLGEGFGSWTMGDDDALLPLLTSANVACGFHAGDPLTIDRTVARCAELGVAVGAHPAFPDLRGFGRRDMRLTADELRTDTIYQVGAVAAFARVHGAPLAHVSPHGRLGNVVVTDTEVARAVLDGIAAVDEGLVVASQEGELTRLARERGMRVAVLGFADRGYRADGTLVPRAAPGALVHDPAEIARRAVRMVVDGVVTAIDGTEVPVAVDSVLLHGDSPGAVDAARAVREALTAAGVTLAAPPRATAD